MVPSAVACRNDTGVLGNNPWLYWDSTSSSLDLDIPLALMELNKVRQDLLAEWG